MSTDSNNRIDVSSVLTLHGCLDGTREVSDAGIGSIRRVMCIVFIESLAL